jgi:periplasmic protein TonB
MTPAPTTTPSPAATPAPAGAATPALTAAASQARAPTAESGDRSALEQERPAHDRAAEAESHPTDTGGNSAAEAAKRVVDDEAGSRQASDARATPSAEPQLLRSVPPVYPVAAEKNGTEGWVDLDFTINESGSVEHVTVQAAKPAGVFDRAAVAALSQWHYRPVTEDGKAVAQHARIRIRFALPH